MNFTQEHLQCNTKAQIQSSNCLEASYYSVMLNIPNWQPWPHATGSVHGNILSPSIKEQHRKPHLEERVHAQLS